MKKKTPKKTVPWFRKLNQKSVDDVVRDGTKVLVALTRLVEEYGAPSVVASHLKLVGFWRTPGKIRSVLPDPADLVDPTWRGPERDRVLAHLRAGKAIQRYMGFSTCRICGKMVDGSGDMSDGVYVWPEGLPHYLTEHDVRLPAEFVAHVMSKPS